MRSAVLSLLLALSSLTLYSQSLRNAELLNKGEFSVGINAISVNNSFGYYFLGSYGLSRKADLALRIGNFDIERYIGADIRWNLKNTGNLKFSLLTGVHRMKDFGVDLGLAAGFRFFKYFNFFSGIDSDLNFNQISDRFLWVPMGVTIKCGKKIRLVLEEDIPLVKLTPEIRTGGISFVF